MSFTEIETLSPRYNSLHELRIEELEKLTGACGTIIKNEDNLLRMVRGLTETAQLHVDLIARQTRRIDKLEIDVEQLEDAAMKG